MNNDYTLPFNALKTHAIAKNPIPTEPNPHPAISLYLKAPNPIRAIPTTIIITVAHAKTPFLFILGFFRNKKQISENIVDIKSYNLAANLLSIPLLYFILNN